MIKLKYGSIFDEKCELLIIPCNSQGAVTSWVFENLRTNGIETPKKQITFGKVDYTKTNLSLENAEFVGYAASVDFNKNISTIEAIDSISKSIETFCQNNDITKVNIPLLGTGSGGLSPFSVFETFYSSFSDSHLEVNIYTPSNKVYGDLFSAHEEDITTENEKIRSPRVFISYTAVKKENGIWVKKLTEKLRANGIDARLDIFHLKPGVDLPQWMTNEVILADKVLLICDYDYMIKADVRKGGVGWETMIIQGDMLSQGEAKNKYVALIREDEVDKALPIYMKSKLAINWGKKEEIHETEFKELLFALFDCDMEPELGEIPKEIVKRVAASNKNKA